MPDYGTDVGGALDIDPLLRLKSGPALMADIAARRLFCGKGQLLSNPNDNTLDARDFIAEGISGAADLIKIQAQCQSVLLADPRIFTASIVASFNFETRLLTLKIKGTGSHGPFALTLIVSEVTVAKVINN